MTDRLAELLREVDALAPPPAGTANVVGAVSRRRVRRRRSRIAISAAAITTAAAAMVTNYPPARAPAPIVPVAVAPLEVPMGLKPETLVRLHELTAEKLQSRQAQRRSREDALSRTDDPSPDELRDRAALILIYDADESFRAHRRDDAVAMYRRAIELFPQSPWADVARERLNRS